MYQQLFQPPIRSVMMRDILDSIASREIILKIDVEGYECKALQPEILQNKVGKFLPFIFMEWGQLPHNNLTCPQFQDWVKNFYTGGYVPVNPGKLNSPGEAESNQVCCRNSKAYRGL